MNKIIIGDCLDELTKFSDNSFDMVVSDFPYFRVLQDAWDNQWKTLNDYLTWIENIVSELFRVLKNNRNIFLFTGRQYNRHVNLILDKYFIEKRIIIWARKRTQNQTFGNSLTSGYEPISFYSKGSGKTNKIKIMPLRLDLKKRYEKHPYLKDGIVLSDVWDDIPALSHNSREKLNHKSQKPLELIERIIKLGSCENDYVLDVTAGTLTTAAACENLNRHYVCVEKNSTYVLESIKRLRFFKFDGILEK